VWQEIFGAARQSPAMPVHAIEARSSDSPHPPSLVTEPYSLPPALQGKRARSIIQFLAVNCTPSTRDPKLQVSLFVALLEALPCEEGDEDDSQLQFANPVLAAVRAAALLFLAAENDSLHAQQVWNAWQLAVGLAICGYAHSAPKISQDCVKIGFFDRGIDMCMKTFAAFGTMLVCVVVIF
jgi:hypothetical protein